MICYGTKFRQSIWSFYCYFIFILPVLVACCSAYESLQDLTQFISSFSYEQLLLTLPKGLHAHCPVYFFPISLFITICFLFLILTFCNPALLLFGVHTILFCLFFTLLHVFSFIQLLPIICKCLSLWTVNVLTFQWLVPFPFSLLQSFLAAILHRLFILISQPIFGKHVYL